MVKRFLGDSKANEKKYHKMWDDHSKDAGVGGYYGGWGGGGNSDKARKYDNLAYAGYEGMDGHRAANWEAGGSTSNPEWTD